MSARPWMPLYAGDYLRDTGRLSTLQHGAYLLLIMDYWINNGLPDDDEQLARIARMSDREWRANRAALAQFFTDGWKHKRIEKELAEAEEAYERRAQAGKKGGIARSRGKQCASNATSNAGGIAGSKKG